MSIVSSHQGKVSGNKAHLLIDPVVKKTNMFSGTSPKIKRVYYNRVDHGFTDDRKYVNTQFISSVPAISNELQYVKKLFANLFLHQYLKCK